MRVLYLKIAIAFDILGCSFSLARFMLLLVPPGESLACITVIASKWVILLPFLAPSLYYTWKSLITSLLKEFQCFLNSSKSQNHYSGSQGPTQYHQPLLLLPHLRLSTCSCCPPATWVFADLWSCLVCSCFKALYPLPEHDYGGICKVHPHLTQVFTKKHFLTKALPVLSI